VKCEGRLPYYYYSLQLQTTDYREIAQTGSPGDSETLLAAGAAAAAACHTCHLPRLHDHDYDHDSATREDLGARGGARGPGPARAGLLRLQCSARVLFRTASFKIK
jgi:hypothetical protein